MRLGSAFPLAVLLGALATASCGYSPPAQTDRTSAAYRADIAACEDGTAAEVNRRNAKTGLAWLSSPVRRWGQISDGVQSCMAGRGYGQVRTCTDDEIRSRAPNLVVTAAGVRCSDPPDARRRSRT